MAPCLCDYVHSLDLAKAPDPPCLAPVRPVSDAGLVPRYPPGAALSPCAAVGDPGRASVCAASRALPWEQVARLFRCSWGNNKAKLIIHKAYGFREGELILVEN